jgi:recombination protein RecA
MAKKKQVVSETETAPGGILNESLLSKFGNVILPADQVPVGRVVPIMLGLDIALNGGIVEGTITHIAAPTRCGKTTLTLFIIAKMQQALKKECYYIDIEGRLRPELLKSIKGLVYTKEQSEATGIPQLQIIRSTDQKVMSAEDYFNISNSLLINKSNCLVVFDSLAMLESSNQHANDLGQSSMLTEIPKLTYTWLRKISPVISSKSNNLITLTHIQDSPSKYGPGKREVGGNAIKFMASNHFEHRKNEFIEESQGGKVIGQVTTYRTLKSALGAPLSEFNVCITYGQGIDEERDTFMLGVEYGFISKSGAWYELEYKVGDESKSEKTQGEARMIEFLRNNREAYDWLYNSIKQFVLGT